MSRHSDTSCSTYVVLDHCFVLLGEPIVARDVHWLVVIDSIVQVSQIVTALQCMAFRCVQRYTNRAMRSDEWSSESVSPATTAANPIAIVVNARRLAMISKHPIHPSDLCVCRRARVGAERRGTPVRTESARGRFYRRTARRAVRVIAAYHGCDLDASRHVHP